MLLHAAQRAFSRRDMFSRVAAGAALFVTPGAFAEELMRTPAQTEGPFYPDKMPLDTDNDLLVLNDAITPAVGEITWLSGRILDSRGEPVRGARVEIWQVDANAAYLHSKTGNREKRDANFQGFGRCITASSGDYLFRTIKPVPYPGRTPHIHVMVKVPKQEKFVTQCYIKGHPGNEKDGPFKGLKTAREREALSIDFNPVPQSRIGELAAKFNIVLGYTPAQA